MKLETDTFATVKDFGAALIAAEPRLKGRDPEELGKRALALPRYKGVAITPVNYGDIDVATTLKNLPGDILDVGEELLEGVGQMIAHPIDTAGALKDVGLGLAEAGLEEVGLDVDIASDEQETMGRGMARQFAESVSPAGIQNRPANALGNALSVLPAGAMLGGLSKGAKAAKFGRTAKALDTARKAVPLVDPGQALTAVPAAAAQGTKNVLSRLAGATKHTVSGAAGQARNRFIGERVLSTPEFNAGEHFLGTALALPMGQPGPAVSTIIRDSGIFSKTNRAIRQGDGTTTRFTDAVRDVQQLPTEEMAPVLTRKVQMGIDHIHAEKRKAHKEAMGSGQMRSVLSKRVPRTDYDIFDLFAAIIENNDMGLRLVRNAEGDKMFSLAFDRDIFASEGAKRRLTKHIEELMNMGFEPGQTVSFKRRSVTWGQLHDFREKLDDVISTLAPTGTSARYRAALIDLRADYANVISGALDQLTNGAYSSAMAKYRRLSKFENEVAAWLGAVPGQLDELGDLVPQKTRSVYDNLRFAFSGDPDDARALPVIRELEDAIADDTITPYTLGAMMKDPLGGGLVGRSTASEIARKIVVPAGVGYMAVVGGLVGALGAGIPAAVLISPRVMSRILTGIPDLADALRAQGTSIGQVVQQTQGRLKNITNSRVAATVRFAVKNGWNLGQLQERLEQQGVTDQETKTSSMSPTLLSILKKAR